MKVPPASVALWIVSVFMLLLYLTTTLLGYDVIDPLSTIIFFLLFQEISKFLAELSQTDGE